MVETWKDIPGYNGRYAVSDLGRVKNQERHTVLSGTVGANGYRYVGLSLDGKLKVITVHSLVMLAHKGERPADLQVCHGDGDQANNALTNLRYDTAKANAADKVKHGTATGHANGGGTVSRNVGSKNGKARLSEEDVLTIRQTPKARGSGRMLAQLYQVDETLISHLRAGRGWSHVSA